jgi:lipoprotein LpqH
MSKHGSVVAIGGAAILIAGLVGCSGPKGTPGPSAADSGSQPDNGSATSGDANGVVQIDGKVVSTGGLIDCQDMKNVGYILTAWGDDGSAQVTLTFSKPRELIEMYVKDSKNDDGHLISYKKEREGETGDATMKVGGNTYTISGKAAKWPSEQGDGLHEFFVKITCP